MDALTAAAISHPHASKAMCAETPSACTLSGSAPRVKRSVSLVGSSRPIRASSNPSKQRSFFLHRRSSSTPNLDLDQHSLELEFRSLDVPQQKYKMAGIQQMGKEQSASALDGAKSKVSSLQGSDPFQPPATVGRSFQDTELEEEKLERENKMSSSDESNSADSLSPASSTDTHSPPGLLSNRPFGHRSDSSWKLSSTESQMVENAADQSNLLGLGRGPRGGALVGRSLSSNDLNSYINNKPSLALPLKQKYFVTPEQVPTEPSSTKDQVFSPRQFEDALQQYEPVAGVYEGAWDQVEKVVEWNVRQLTSKNEEIADAETEVFSPRQFEDAVHQYESLEAVRQASWSDSIQHDNGIGEIDSTKSLDPESRSATHEAPEFEDLPAGTLDPDAPPMSPDSNNLDLHLRSAAIALEELRESVLQRPRALSNQVPRSAAVPDGFHSIKNSQSPGSVDLPVVRNWPVDNRRSRRSDLSAFGNEKGTPDSLSPIPDQQTETPELDQEDSPALRGRSVTRTRNVMVDSGAGAKLRKRGFGQRKKAELGAESGFLPSSPSLGGQEGLGGMGGGIGLGLFEMAQSKVEQGEGLGIKKRDTNQVFYDAREALEEPDFQPPVIGDQSPDTAPAAAAEAQEESSEADPNSTSEPSKSDSQPIHEYKASTSKIDHTISKKQPEADVPNLPKHKKGSTTMRGRHWNVSGNSNSSSTSTPSASPSTSWSCTTAASIGAQTGSKTKSWTSALAASSVPSSPQLLASPTMGSASGSPMLNGTPTMSLPGTPMETQSGFGGDVPVQAQPAATPAYDGASGAASDAAPGFQASIATVIAASAIGFLMLIGAIIWAALFRRRRSRRRRHLAGVLEKFGASSSDSQSDMSGKSSMSVSRSSRDTLVDSEKAGAVNLYDEKKAGVGHIGAGIGYGTSEFGKAGSAKPVESKAYFVAQRASARASALNIVSPWSMYDESSRVDSKSSPNSAQENSAETDDEELSRSIALGLVVESDPRNTARMSRDLARSGLVSEALAPVRDATFSWQHPTLSLPPAAARALATGHYVKKRTTLPAKSRVPVPPMIAPLSSLGSNSSSALSRAASESSVAPPKLDTFSSSSDIDPEFQGDSTRGTLTQSKLSGIPTAMSQPTLPQRNRSDSSTTAGGSATTISNSGISASIVGTDGSTGNNANGWFSRMLGLQSSASRDNLSGQGESNSASAGQSSNGDSGISVSVSDGEFAEVRFVTGRASLGHGQASPQLQSIGGKTQSKHFSGDPLISFPAASAPALAQELVKKQPRASKGMPSGSIRRNPNWHSSLPACREESEETIFVIGEAPVFSNPKSNMSKACVLLGRGLGDVLEDTSGSEDERKSGYDGGGETDVDSRISYFVATGKTYKTSNEAIAASSTPTQASHSSFLGPYGGGSHQHRTLPPIRVPSITLTLEDETLGEVERPLSLGSHSESGTTSEEESGTDERIMAMIGRAPAYHPNPHINPRVSSNVRESTQSAASFFSSHSSDEEEDTEDSYDPSGRASRAGTRSSRSSQPLSRASQDSVSVGEKTPRNTQEHLQWSDRPDSETDAEGVYIGERYEEEIDLDGYGSESAEGCLELSDFPTLPSWTPAEKAAHAAARADKSAYRSQSIKREKR